MSTVTFALPEKAHEEIEKRKVDPKLTKQENFDKNININNIIKHDLEGGKVLIPRMRIK